MIRELFTKPESEAITQEQYENAILTIRKYQDQNGLESWEPIPGFEGRYEVSNFGRVKSLKHQQALILKGCIINNNSYVVLQHPFEGRKQYRRDYLMAITFLEGQGSEYKPGYLDGNPNNLSRTNLKWVKRKNY